MNRVPLDIYLIETPASQRSLPIIEMLQDDIDINLIRLPALMVRTPADIQEFKIDVLRRSFFVMEGRELTLGEIGCAASHNLARKLLAESPLGGVILEDDARIIDLNIFKEISQTFLHQKYGTKSVLSLTGLRPNNLQKRNLDAPRISWNNVLGNTPLAVANVITPLAAAEFLKFNSPIRYVADWPYSKCKFYAVDSSIVEHGDAGTVSTIDFSGSDERSELSIKSKFRILLLLPFIFTRQSNVSFREYIYWVYVRRISHRINCFAPTTRKSMND